MPMRTMKSRWTTRLSKRPFPALAGIILGWVISHSCFATAQQNQAILITSPLEGTIVNPGQTVTVNVAAQTGVTVSGVFVVGENPIDSGPPADSTPAQLSITIPTALPS